MDLEIKRELIKGWLLLMKLRGGEAVEAETSGPHQWVVRTRDTEETAS